MNTKHQGFFRFLLAAGCISLLPTTQLLAAGYKVPENSVNSTALSAAYVANAHGADAAYYNPAAMVFNKEGGAMEGNLTVIHLSSIDYSGTSPSDSSKKENFLVPSFHYVSPSMGNARFGLSVITPAGLSKRWDGTGRATAEEFTLETIEVNPSVAYKFNDKFSAAIGARMIYSTGVVKSYAAGGLVMRDLEGSSYDFGYNLALHFKPTKDLALAATYRSKIDLTIEGNAKLNYLGSLYGYTGPDDASVEIPIPASLNLAAAYTFNDRTTVELVYEKTYWSAYKKLDFDYDPSVVSAATVAFGTPITKDWSDSNTYRIGVTHKLDNQWTLMAGYAYDNTPVPKKTVGFELPDSDAQLFSFGARYQYSDDMNIGFGVLYDKKKTLKLSPSDGNSGTGLDTAKFENANAVLFTMGLQYTF